LKWNPKLSLLINGGFAKKANISPICLQVTFTSLIISDRKGGMAEAKALKITIPDMTAPTFQGIQCSLH